MIPGLNKAQKLIRLEKELEALNRGKLAAEATASALNSQRIAIQIADVQAQISNLGKVRAAARLGAPTLEFATEAVTFPIASNAYSQSAGAISDIIGGNKVEFSLVNIIPTDFESYEHSAFMLGAPKLFSKALGGVVNSVSKRAAQSKIYRYADWTGQGAVF